jgi:hypothetical protein
VEDTESTEFLSELMQEAPGGPNFGRAALSTRDPEQTERHVSLGVGDAQAREFMSDGGWGIVTIKDGSRAGIHAHRGVLRGDEHIDVDAVRRAVEHELGFTIDDVLSVYRQGRMTDSQRELRGHIDARLLALSRSGANMLALARIFGWQVKPGNARGGPACWIMEQALARACAAECSA